MPDIIPPRRDELLTAGGIATIRFAEYLENVASTSNENANVASQQSLPLTLTSALADINQRIGSGNTLTWDDTGFTWDADIYSFDQDEA